LAAVWQTANSGERRPADSFNTEVMYPPNLKNFKLAAEVFLWDKISQNEISVDKVVEVES
jgi:hypothetical protein